MSLGAKEEIEELYRVFSRYSFCSAMPESGRDREMFELEDALRHLPLRRWDGDSTKQFISSLLDTGSPDFERALKHVLPRLAELVASGDSCVGQWDLKTVLNSADTTAWSREERLALESFLATMNLTLP